MNHYAKVCRSRPNKKKNSFGCLPSADESDFKESSGRIVIGKRESHSISAKTYNDSPDPSNNPQLITLVTDTGVSETLLNRLDWEKVKHLCTFVTASKCFRPFGTAYPTFPFEEKQKSPFMLKKVPLLNHIYVADNKREQSLLGEKDAISLGTVKLHPQGAAKGSIYR